MSKYKARRGWSAPKSGGGGARGRWPHVMNRAGGGVNVPGPVGSDPAPRYVNVDAKMMHRCSHSLHR